MIAIGWVWLGLLFGCLVVFEQSLWLYCMLVIVIWIGFCVYTDQEYILWLCGVGWVAGVLSGGMAILYHAEHVNYLPDFIVDEQVTLEVKSHGIMINRLQRFDANFKYGQRRFNLRIYSDHPSLVKPHDLITGRLKLRKPAASINGGFDYERWSAVHNIHGSGFMHIMDLVTVKQVSFWLRWRNRLTGVIEDVVSDVERAAVWKALLLGDRDGLSAEQWRFFRETGLAHVVAVSGMHLGVVYFSSFYVSYFFYLLMCFFLN